MTGRRVRYNPATEGTARALLRAVKGERRAKAAVKRAKRAVNRPAKRRAVRSLRDRVIEKAMKRSGGEFPREFLEEIVHADGTVSRPRGMPDDVWEPLLRAVDQPSGRRRTVARRPPPADELERLARSEEAAEFQERLARAGHGRGRFRAWRDNPRRKLAGRALEVETKRGELVAVHGPHARDVRRGLRLFEDWSGRAAGGVEVRAVPRDTPAVLVRLGELAGVIYRSNKWDGRRRDYLHETSAPRPELCATPDGRRLVILGGAVRVRPEGLIR